MGVDAVDDRVVLRFKSELSRSTGDKVDIELSGTVADVRRAAVETFGLDAGALSLPLDVIAISAASKWVAGIEAFRAGSEGAQAVNAVVDAFAGSAIVNPENGRRVGEGPVAVEVVSPEDHRHAAYAKAVLDATESAAVAKMAKDYQKVPDHDPELLQQMREKWQELNAAEKAAARVA